MDENGEWIAQLAQHWADDVRVPGVVVIHRNQVDRQQGDSGRGIGVERVDALRVDVFRAVSRSPRIEGVDRIESRFEDFAELLLGFFGNRSEVDALGFAQVDQQRALPTRVEYGRHEASLRSHSRGEEFERIQHLVDRSCATYPIMLEERIVGAVFASERTAVRPGELCAALASTGLQGDDRDISFRCFYERGPESLRVANGFEKEADHSRRFILEHKLHVVRHRRCGFAAGRDDVVEIHAALILEKSLPDGAAVADHRGITLWCFRVHPITRYREPMARRNEPHAVRAAKDDVVLLRDLSELILQRELAFDGLRVGAREDDCGGNPALRGFLERSDQPAIGHREDGEVWPLR